MTHDATTLRPLTVEQVQAIVEAFDRAKRSRAECYSTLLMVPELLNRAAAVRDHDQRVHSRRRSALMRKSRQEISAAMKHVRSALKALEQAAPLVERQLNIDALPPEPRPTGLKAWADGHFALGRAVKDLNLVSKSLWEREDWTILMTFRRGKPRDTGRSRLLDELAIVLGLQQIRPTTTQNGLFANVVRALLPNEPTTIRHEDLKQAIDRAAQVVEKYESRRGS